MYPLLTQLHPQNLKISWMLFQSINQISISPISPAKPGSVARVYQPQVSPRGRLLTVRYRIECTPSALIIVLEQQGGKHGFLNFRSFWLLIHFISTETITLTCVHTPLPVTNSSLCKQKPATAFLSYTSKVAMPANHIEILTRL